MTLVCHVCFPNAIDLGEFVEGFSLVFWDNHWRLITGQQHKGDDVLVFDKAPYPDPDPLCLSEEGDTWIEDAEFYLKADLSTMTSYFLVKGCVEQGYQTHKPLAHWIYNRAGRMIQEKTSCVCESIPS